MLNDTKLRSARPRATANKLTDSHRLYLRVKPNGSKLRKWTYTHDDKPKTMALGLYWTKDAVR